MSLRLLRYSYLGGMAGAELVDGDAILCSKIAVFGLLSAGFNESRCRGKELCLFQGVHEYEMEGGWWVGLH